MYEITVSALYAKFNQVSDDPIHRYYQKNPEELYIQIFSNYKLREPFIFITESVLAQAQYQRKNLPRQALHCVESVQ